MRTIPEVVEDIKNILNNAEKMQTGDSLVDINELADEILSINCYEKKATFDNLDRKSFKVDLGHMETTKRSGYNG